MAKNVAIENDMHRALKAYADDSGMKMTIVVRRALLKWFEVNSWVPPKKRERREGTAA
jgi:hypothetical protein